LWVWSITTIQKEKLIEAVFGTVVHQVLKEFYAHEFPFRVTEAFINKRLTQLNDLIQNSFKNELKASILNMDVINCFLASLSKFLRDFSE
jgi:uncharacterized protein with ATP-grasp and redox domains